MIALSPALSWLVIAAATAGLLAWTAFCILVFRFANRLIAATLKALEESTS